MVNSNQDGDIATTTGTKVGVFRKLDENVYDTPLLETIKPKQQTVKQSPAGIPPIDDDTNGYSTPMFDSATTRTVTKQQPSVASQQPQDAPFGDEDPFTGYSTPSFDFVPSVHEPGKVKPSGKNPFIDEPEYEAPMVPDQPIEWQDSKLVQSTEEKKVVTGDYDIPPEPNDLVAFSSNPGDYDIPPEPDDLVAFSSDPFSNSSNTYTSLLDTKRDYVNDVTSAPSYNSSKDGTTTTTALSFESDDGDDDAVINPLLDVEDFAKYLDADGDDDMWANLLNQKFN